jgi:hypothetical protein
MRSAAARAETGNSCTKMHIREDIPSENEYIRKYKNKNA